MTKHDPSPILPGRLQDPERSLRDDPRADPRMIAALAPYRLDRLAPPGPMRPDSPMEARLAFTEAVEAANEAMFEALSAGVTPPAGVERRVERVVGDDGHEITLHVHRPAGVDGPLPGVLHLHGGGMTILSAASQMYTLWRDELAVRGLVVVGPEFRNAGGKLGPHPFPAGLNDCSRALDWMHASREQLGLSTVVLSGESGGANLCLATALKAHREGRSDAFQGVYAMCPFISNLWHPREPALVSMFENDGYFLNCEAMGTMASLYDPTGEHARDPLCWPYHATESELEGLPPHVISVNELDPLRDEGLAFYRKLLRANVSAVSRTVNGTCHAGDLMFPAHMPDVTDATLRDVVAFARSIARASE